MALLQEDGIDCLILLRRRWWKFSKRQVDESTIHNQAVLLVYVRFIHEDYIWHEMLFINRLPESTTGEDIFNEVMSYFTNENTPLTNLINIAPDGGAAMTGKVKQFISRMKSVALTSITSIVLTTDSN